MRFRCRTAVWSRILIRGAAGGLDALTADAGSGSLCSAPSQDLRREVYDTDRSHSR